MKIVFDFLFSIIRFPLGLLPPMDRSPFVGEKKDYSKSSPSVSHCGYDITNAKDFFVYTNLPTSAR